MLSVRGSPTAVNLKYRLRNIETDRYGPEALRAR
jgi:hypothetical protein